MEEGTQEEPMWQDNDRETEQPNAGDENEQASEVNKRERMEKDYLKRIP
jgi:hypothetical protein